MPAIAERLRNYAVAITDPTRGAIVLELHEAGELTATQLAGRLGLTPNNVYHHMRVLLQHGVVDPPRAAPAESYVEKYYQINREIRAALRLDPLWHERTQEMLTLEDRQAVLVSLCLTMAHLLRRAAQRYAEMDAEAFDRIAREQQRLMLTIRRLSRDELQGRLTDVRNALYGGDSEWMEDLGPRTDLLLIAGLPFSSEE